MSRIKLTKVRMELMNLKKTRKLQVQSIMATTINQKTKMKKGVVKVQLINTPASVVKLSTSATKSTMKMTREAVKLETGHQLQMMKRLDRLEMLQSLQRKKIRRNHKKWTNMTVQNMTTTISCQPGKEKVVSLLRKA